VQASGRQSAIQFELAPARERSPNSEPCGALHRKFVRSSATGLFGTFPRRVTSTKARIDGIPSHAWTYSVRRRRQKQPALRTPLANHEQYSALCCYSKTSYCNCIQSAQGSNTVRTSTMPMRVARGMSQSLSIVLLLLTCCARSGQNEVHRVRNIVLVHGAWADGSGWKGV
jgi:hypothetical protein